MDGSKSDVDFDSYWDEEARNPNRNRIRIGRQYQAQVPPLIKNGENDGRKLEDLETLTWNPQNQLTGHQLNQYFAIAKSIGLFIQAIDTCQDGIEENECLEEEKCSLRPFEILDSGTKCVLEAKPERPVNTNNVIPSPEKQSVTTRQRLQQQQQQNKPKEAQPKEEMDPSSSSPLKQSSNTRIQSVAKGLPAFILSHHSSQHDKLCKFTSTAEQAINLGSTEKYNVKTLAKLLMRQWNEAEAKVFAQAIKECGKNFSAIKKDYLPWKSVRSIIEFYYLALDKEKQQQKKQWKTENKTNKSPLPENKKKSSSGSGNNSSETKSTSQNKDSDQTRNDTGNNNDQTQSQNEEKSESGSEQDKEEMVTMAKGVKNDNITIETGNMRLTSTGNINGNNTFLSSPPETRHSMAGQEVKPIKAKPILSHGNDATENGALDVKANLGSLNLYLHGELVLRLNAQKQESGQKWVESAEMPLKRKFLGSLNNGFSHGSRCAGGKRALDSKNMFREDPDDISLGGSGSDDDSMTSNESSSLVASSPSSSSTITSAVKKARVKLENLNSSIGMNGSTTTAAAASSPNSNGRKSESSSTGLLNGTNKPSSQSLATNYFDNSLTELDIKKKLFEYCQMGISPEDIQMLWASTLLADPPKAHSNSSLGNDSIFSPGKQGGVTKSLPEPLIVQPPPVVTPPTTTSSSSTTTTSNGYTNGFMSGPVDLTRKSPINNHHHHQQQQHHSERNQSSPSSRHKASSTFSLPRAHESSSLGSSPSASLQHHRRSPFVLTNSSPFSLPAPPPPPPNVPVSPHKSSTTTGSLRKSSMIREEAAAAANSLQYAK